MKLTQEVDEFGRGTEPRAAKVGCFLSAKQGLSREICDSLNIFDIVSIDLSYLKLTCQKGSIFPAIEFVTEYAAYDFLSL